MFWELWDLDSKNLIETFDTEVEALQAVRELLAVNHRDLIDELGLGANYDEDESHEVPLPPSLSGDILRARLAETAQDASAREATRAVHGKIRRWLAEEGWQVRDVTDPQASFNVMVVLDAQEQVNVFQRIDHLDHITVALHAQFLDTGSSAHPTISPEIRRRVRRQIERDALMMGLEAAHRSDSPIGVQFEAYIYFDGLSKDKLIEKMLLILRAVSLSLLTIDAACEPLVDDQPQPEASLATSRSSSSVRTLPVAS